jgi:hypothetical protein
MSRGLWHAIAFAVCALAPIAPVHAQEVPGLSAQGICDDVCLRYLFALSEFEGVLDHRFERHLWFSSFAGNDANPGTYSAPMQTLARAWETCVLVHSSRCTLKDDGSVWSALTLAFVPPADLSAFDVGVEVSWGAAVYCRDHTQTGTAIGLDRTRRRMAVRRTSDTVAPPRAGDFICAHGEQGGVWIAGVADTATVPGNQPLPLAQCPDPEEACILFEGENPARRPLVDFDWRDQGGPVFLVDDTSANLGGWLAIQNVVFSRSLDDVVSSTSGSGRGGKFITNRMDCVVYNGGTGADNNNCWTTHANNFGHALNGNGTSLATSPYSSGSPVAPTGTGGFVWLSEGEAVAVQTRPDTAVPAVGFTGCDGIFIGGSFRGRRAGESYMGWHAIHYGLNMSSDRTRRCRLQLARLSAQASYYGNKAALVVHVRNSNVAHEVEIHDARLSGYRGIISYHPSSTVSLIGRAVVIDDTIDVALRDAGGARAGTVTVDLEGVYDSDDVGGLCFDGTNAFDSQAGCDAALGARAQFFANRSIDGASGDRADGIHWSRNQYASVTGPMTFLERDPMADGIRCSACDFLAAGFEPGMTVRADSAGSPYDNQNQAEFRIVSVDARELTLDSTDDVVAGDGIYNVREYTLPRLLPHPQHNAAQIASDDRYVIMAPRPEMQIPRFVTRARRRVVGFLLSYDHSVWVPIAGPYALVALGGLVALWGARSLRSRSGRRSRA